MCTYAEMSHKSEYVEILLKDRYFIPIIRALLIKVMMDIDKKLCLNEKKSDPNFLIFKMADFSQLILSQIQVMLSK